MRGKIAVVTGASMGIGEAIARLFAEEGATVVLSSRDAARAEAARQRIGCGERTLALACDVRRRDEIARLLELVIEKYGRIDIWVNNAGYGISDTVIDMDMDGCRDMFDTNLFGALDGMQLAGALMRRQKSGTIINIASVAGFIALPYSAGYAATKFAMRAFGNAARMELKGTGVQVLNVCPGFVDTNFKANVVRGRAGRNMSNPIRGTTAEHVAHATLNGYLAGRREVVVPWFYSIFIKLYQLMPGTIEWFMAMQSRRGKD